MKILKLDFKKNKNGKTDLKNTKNLENLQKWILPVIVENEGWGTGGLTFEEFHKNPKKFQDHVDATVWNNVHVFLDDGEPVGILEFTKSKLDDISKERHAFLNNLLKSKEFSEFNNLIGTKFDEKLIPEVTKFFKGKNIYTSVGVVLAPSWQGKKSGLSEKLYEVMKDGIVYGFTSNPVILRQRRKIFKNTLFFPLFGYTPKDAEEWAVCLYAYSGRKFPGQGDSINGIEFGAIYSIYNVEDRGEEYLKIAKEMRIKGKITELDEKRLKYVLSKKSCASAIISWN